MSVLAVADHNQTYMCVQLDRVRASRSQTNEPQKSLLSFVFDKSSFWNAPFRFFLVYIPRKACDVTVFLLVLWWSLLTQKTYVRNLDSSWREGLIQPLLHNKAALRGFLIFFFLRQRPEAGVGRRLDASAASALGRNWCPIGAPCWPPIDDVEKHSSTALVAYEVLIECTRTCRHRMCPGCRSLSARSFTCSLIVVVYLEYCGTFCSSKVVDSSRSVAVLKYNFNSNFLSLFFSFFFFWRGMFFVSTSFHCNWNVRTREQDECTLVTRLF